MPWDVAGILYVGVQVVAQFSHKIILSSLAQQILTEKKTDHLSLMDKFLKDSLRQAFWNSFRTGPSKESSLLLKVAEKVSLSSGLGWSQFKYGHEQVQNSFQANSNNLDSLESMIFNVGRYGTAQSDKWDNPWLLSK
jgi:hypothetical protein